MLILVIIGIPAFFIVLIAITARLEKRMVWPYGNLEPQPQFPDNSGYGARWVGDAIAQGYTFLGWAPDMKGPMYRVSYAFLVSPQRDHFAIIGVGDILKLKLRGTWLYTVGADGSVLYSTDNQSCIHIDVARQWKTHLVFTGNFAGLLSSHDSLVRSLQTTPRTFSPDREMDDFKKLREEHYDNLARLGLLQFTDHSTTHWRYTIYGALKWSVLNYLIGLMRGMTNGSFPRSA